MTRKKMINRSILASVTVGVLVAAFAVLSSSSSQAAIVSSGGHSAPATVPPGLAVPAGQELTSSFLGRGVQVYQCTAGAWVFVEPAANLTGRLTKSPYSFQS